MECRYLHHRLYLLAYILRLVSLLEIFQAFEVCAHPTYGFETGRQQLDEMEVEETAKYVQPNGFWGILWDWLM